MKSIAVALVLFLFGRAATVVGALMIVKGGGYFLGGDDSLQQGMMLVGAILFVVGVVFSWAQQHNPPRFPRRRPRRQRWHTRHAHLAVKDRLGSR